MKDQQSGEPTGGLVMHHCSSQKITSTLSHEECVAALRAAMHELNALGITGIVEASSGPG